MTNPALAWWIAALVVAAIALTLRSRFFPALVRSRSMEPAFRPGSLVLVGRLDPGQPVERGEVLVFRSRELGMTLVKRAIGLPGDRLELRADGSTRVNGLVLPEPYASSRTAFRGSYQVPEGHYFFLGDNREGSEDSRSWERPFIPFGDILGRVLGSPRTGTRGRAP